MLMVVLFVLCSIWNTVVDPKSVSPGIHAFSTPSMAQLWLTRIGGVIECHEAPVFVRPCMTSTTYLCRSSLAPRA